MSEDRLAPSEWEKLSFEDQVDGVLDYKCPRGSAVCVGQTPGIIADVGFNGDLPLFMTAKHIKYACKPKNCTAHTHGLQRDQIKRLPQAISDPVMILETRTQDTNRIVVVTDMLDIDREPIVVAIKPNGKQMYNNKLIQANYILSVYGKDNFADYINCNVQDDKILYINKIKSHSLSNRAKVQFFGGLEGSYDFNVIIRKVGTVVNHPRDKPTSKNSRQPTPQLNSFDRYIANAGVQAKLRNAQRRELKTKQKNLDRSDKQWR